IRAGRHSSQRATGSGRQPSKHLHLRAVARVTGAIVATPEEARAKATATYNAAADRYDDPANAFWERFGRATVERLRLGPGSPVLDVCCGSGASALSAANAVGPEGSVFGIDLAGKLLELARAKAARQGLRNVEFREGDLLDLRLPATHFDAVICVFGIFFVP